MPSHPTSRTPWYKRASTWLGTLVTAIITAVVITVVTQRLPAPSPKPSPEPTRTSVVNLGPSVPPGADNGYSPGWTSTPFVVKNDYISVTASMDPESACVDGGTGWIMPRSVDQLPPIANFSSQLEAWARANRGVPLSGNLIKMELQGLNGHTVIVTDIGVHVVNRRAPVSGTLPEFYTNCGGLSHSYFRANLDTGGSDVSTVPIQGGGVGRVAPPVPLPHSLSETDVEEWILEITTKHCDCSFVPYIDYTSDGVAGRLDIRLGSRPWEVSAAGPGSVHAVHEGLSAKWIPG